MTFEIKGARKIRAGRYEFIVQGPEEWGMQELLPYLVEASKEDKNYRITFDFGNQDPLKIVHRTRHRMQATLTLEDTLSKGMKRLKVSSTGISPRKINYFITRIETELSD